MWLISWKPWELDITEGPMIPGFQGPRIDLIWKFQVVKTTRHGKETPTSLLSKAGTEAVKVSTSEKL